jgi:hypothetical protein
MAQKECTGTKHSFLDTPLGLPCPGQRQENTLSLWVTSYLLSICGQNWSVAILSVSPEVSDSGPL